MNEHTHPMSSKKNKQKKQKDIIIKAQITQTKAEKKKEASRRAQKCTVKNNIESTQKENTGRLKNLYVQRHNSNNSGIQKQKPRAIYSLRLVYILQKMEAHTLYIS